MTIVIYKDWYNSGTFDDYYTAFCSTALLPHYQVARHIFSMLLSTRKCNFAPLYIFAKMYKARFIIQLVSNIC